MPRDGQVSPTAPARSMSRIGSTRRRLLRDTARRSRATAGSRTRTRTCTLAPRRSAARAPPRAKARRGVDRVAVHRTRGDLPLLVDLLDGELSVLAPERVPASSSRFHVTVPKTVPTAPSMRDTSSSSRSRSVAARSRSAWKTSVSPKPTPPRRTSTGSEVEIAAVGREHRVDAVAELVREREGAVAGAAEVRRMNGCARATCIAQYAPRTLPARGAASIQRSSKKRATISPASGENAPKASTSERAGLVPVDGRYVLLDGGEPVVVRELQEAEPWPGAGNGGGRRRTARRRRR